MFEVDDDAILNDDDEEEEFEVQLPVLLKKIDDDNENDVDVALRKKQFRISKRWKNLFKERTEKKEKHFLL